MSTQARTLNESLDLTGKQAVVGGGSQGIGGGAAVRFAKAGASVIILGRNADLLSKTIEECKAVAPQGKEAKYESIKVDLSTISGMKQAAKDIEARSNGKVDYLVHCQGGPPTGTWKANSDGIESRFAVQVLSRFVLNESLAASGVLRESSVSVAAPGGKETEFDLDDIELTRLKDKSGMSSILPYAKRDGIVIDTYTKAFQSKYPNISFYHLYPGIVATNVAENAGMPTLVSSLFKYIIFPIASRTFGNSVESYAEIPVLIAANDGQAKKELVNREGKFLNHNLKRVAMSGWRDEKANQEKVYEKLKGYETTK